MLYENVVRNIQLAGSKVPDCRNPGFEHLVTHRLCGTAANGDDSNLDLEDALGSNNLTPAILVGAGKLGRALLEYNGFEEYGVQIVAAFDCNEQVFRYNQTSKDILPIKQLKEFCTKNQIKIGIITVGSGSAQTVCDEMLESGITAIWNFAPCQLNVPNDILVKQENLALSLAYLNSQICK